MWLQSELAGEPGGSRDPSDPYAMSLGRQTGRFVPLRGRRSPHGRGARTSEAPKQSSLRPQPPAGIDSVPRGVRGESFLSSDGKRPSRFTHSLNSLTSCQPHEGFPLAPPPALHHLGRGAHLEVRVRAAQPHAPQGEAGEHAAAERPPAEAQGGAAPEGKAAVGDAAEARAAEGGAALRGGREGRVADDLPGAGGDGGGDLLQGLLGETGTLGPDGRELGATFDVEHADFFCFCRQIHSVFAMWGGCYASCVCSSREETYALERGKKERRKKKNMDKK